MLYTELTKKAMRLCYKAHDGQLDKGGVPYVFHAFHVAERMQEEYDVCVALLHDVVEDTDYGLSDVMAEGFPNEVIEALQCITRSKQQPYNEYIRVVKTNPIALRVKLADIEHNSDLTRLSVVDEAAKRRLQKYERAKSVLLGDGDAPSGPEKI